MPIIVYHTTRMRRKIVGFPGNWGNCQGKWGKKFEGATQRHDMNLLKISFQL